MSDTIGCGANEKPRTSHLVDDPSSSAFFANGDFPLDSGVLAKFRKGTKILSAKHINVSAWTDTALLHVKLPDGTQEQYFLKCATENHGRLMMEGEFNAMSELYKTMPNLVPKPHSWGKYTNAARDTYFFISQFVNMIDRLPEPNQLCSKLAALHQNSLSPTGKFGFHVTTFQGRIPQAVGWEESWTTFFCRLLQHVIQLDFEANGYWDELDQLEEKILSEIVPRLLGALERDGRAVKPSLIHGDLWEGNTGTFCETGDVYLFDAAAFYAHDELEIGNWRCHYNNIHREVYTKTYLQHSIPSEPREEWDDRNRLYCIYYNIIYSVNHLHTGKAVRQM